MEEDIVEIEGAEESSASDGELRLSSEDLYVDMPILLSPEPSVCPELSVCPEPSACFELSVCPIMTMEACMNCLPVLLQPRRPFMAYHNYGGHAQTVFLP